MEESKLVVVCWSYGGVNEFWVTEDEYEDLENSQAVSLIFYK